MRLKLLLGGAAALISVLWVAGSQALAQSGGYLAGREPDTLASVPQPPEPGSERDKADRAIFKSTRALEGGPRWRLATSDAQLSIRDLLRDYSCGATVSLTPENMPRLEAILIKAVPDITSAYGVPKDTYKRPRPYLRDKGGICVARASYLDKSYDYPSGHAAWAWTTGLMMAEIEPDRAGPILRRARAFGESRAVCGVHSASAVEAARTAADTLIAALNGDPAFRADLEGARAELAALRASPQAGKPEGCEAEAALTAKTPW
jgi:acid phosphatase (class A)